MTVVGRALLQLSAFITVGSLLMLLVTKSGSPARVITIVALVIGLLAMAISIFLSRLGRQDDSPQEEQ